MARAETGPMQFDGDWPGVFIRGDDASYMAMQLSHIADAMPEGTSVAKIQIIQRAARIMRLCNMCDESFDATAVQRMVGFEHARKEPTDAQA